MYSTAVAGLKEMSWTTSVVLGVTGATAGVASGLLGIGGGTVVTPLLAIATPLSQVGVAQWPVRPHEMHAAYV